MSNGIEDYLSNEDIVKVANKAASSFSSTLSRDEIQSCILSALWKAKKRYKTGSKCKLTSFIHRGVVFECLTQRKFNLARTNQLTISVPEKRNDTERVDMLDEIQQCDDPELIYDRFYKNMTINEIAKDRGVCGETIRIRLQKNLKKLRKSMSYGV
ncbi:MAG: hypothetical protein FI729_00930 [SAR202 cluster bacterium]|nr:hypothetical protein [SAR202 cluster bacterium]